MTVQEWSIVVGVVISGMLALGPWMFMVHAKLAALVATVQAAMERLENIAEAHQRLWERHARHESRLETHNVQIAMLNDRLRESEL